MANRDHGAAGPDGGLQMSEIQLGQSMDNKKLIEAIKEHISMLRTDSISKSDTNHRLHEMLSSCDCRAMFDPTAYYSIWSYLVADVNELIKRVEKL